MSLIKTGAGITDIRGGLGGVYFHRDKSGLHSAAKPRKIRRRSAAQDRQRKAFIKARAYSKDERVVSYYIYRALNNLPFIFNAIVTGDPNPDVTGKYIDQGIYNEQRYYKRLDSAYWIWYHTVNDKWYITNVLGAIPGNMFWRVHSIEGDYQVGPTSYGTPTVTLNLTPPPTDYQIPHLQEP